MKNPIISIMGKCDEITLLMEKELDHQISCREKIKIHFHLLGCHFCRKYRAQIWTLHFRLKRLGDQIKESPIFHLSPEKKEILTEKILRELSGESSL